MNKQQIVPLLFARKDECCGCAACEAVCHKDAIHMILDLEGFYYPVIDADKCINCGFCVNVCAFSK